MRVFRGVAVVAAALCVGAAGALKGPVEEYVREAVPPGFQVVTTEVDGALYTDAAGRVLYTWPQKGQIAGQVGEQAGKPTCDNTKQQKTTGYMAPYPGGLELPDVATRPTCAESWPPVYADDDAKPIGKWSIVTRTDGKKQWAYGGYALYTSALDREPGYAIAAGQLRAKGASGAARYPAGPSADVPAQFAVTSTRTGRLLSLITGPSVYTYDKDGPNKSNCDAACEQSWEPVLAANTAPVARGDWSIFERSPGIKQWAFRRRPLYTRIGEERPHSFDGGDIPGWHNVYTQPAPNPPKGFTYQDTPRGQVLADARGRTLYIYNCIEDSFDQGICDHPNTTQVYRWAVCGGGDPIACAQNFPYVVADRNAKSDSQIWNIVWIDPKTGKFAPENQAGALRVWAYRDRPIYTFIRDQKPGDAIADSWGEGNGWRNGYHAVWVRDQYSTYNE